MLWGALLFLALLSAAATGYANRARRRATAWRRHPFAFATFAGSFLFAMSLGSSSYLFWYAHRIQPVPLHQQLFQGIDYDREIRQSPRKMVIHVITIDLNAPGIRFLVTPAQPTDGRDLHARKTSVFLEKFRLQLAINANYFYPFRSESPFDYFPHAGDGVDVCGYAASLGHVYSNKPWRPGTLFISQTNQASFETPIGPVYNAISGGGFILRNGVVQPPPLIADEKDEPYPRAALGLSKDSTRMFLVMIDGKQRGYSEGVTLTELAQIASEHGADTAIRLDEGGSCALATEDGPGVAKLLNVPINNRIPYRERVVANHLGVFAGPGEVINPSQ
jgi:hypothetical protein